MNKNKNIFVVGGDMRLGKAAEGLKAHGFNVSGFGTCEVEDLSKMAYEEGIAWADIILLGLPSSADQTTIFAPMHNEKLPFTALLSSMRPGSLLLGGRLDTHWCSELDKKGIFYYDYFLREELAILNAVPTAEGAIEIAMSELPTTICGSNFLITGFGRIAKCLAKMLHGIGANVCIAARSYKDLAWAQALGYQNIHISTLAEHVARFDVITNTVPHRIIDNNVLSSMNNDALIIDLASKPGGVDMSCAKSLGRKVIWALSLPGRVAPLTAGTIISTTVINIINELENEKKSCDEFKEWG
jgi:dipicolinate synthase subunit A